MSSTMYSERMMGSSVNTTSAPAAMPMPSMAPFSTGQMMIPRCTFRLEKCTGGMKIHCCTDDATACAMIQNLCQMLSGGMCTMTCLMNGMTACTCNFAMCMPRCEVTETGCCITCTSGDAACCTMIQGCCDCLAACMKAGCTCCLTMGGTPVCCGTC